MRFTVDCRMRYYGLDKIKMNRLPFCYPNSWLCMSNTQIFPPAPSRSWAFPGRIAAHSIGWRPVSRRWRHARRRQRRSCRFPHDYGTNTLWTQIMAWMVIIFVYRVNETNFIPSVVLPLGAWSAAGLLRSAGRGPT